MMRRLGWCVTAVGLMLGSAPALSQDAGWFVGAGIGYMKTDDTCPVTAAPGSNCEDEDTVWKIFGGHQFNPYLGVEFALVDLNDRPVTVTGLGSANAKFRIFELTLLGTLPITQRAAVYAKAGLFHWDVDFELAAGASGYADANGNDYTYGLGVKYQFSRNAALRLEWQRYNDVGDPGTTGQFNADVFGIGALFRF